MRRVAGFTIVELMVVIVVIAIMTTMTYLFIGKWRQDIAVTSVKNELMHANAALTDKRNFTNSYPVALSGVYTSSREVSLVYTLRVNQTFCLNAASTSVTTVTWYIDSALGSDPRQGTCS